MKKRIVITGYGVINALGKGKEAVEKRLFDGEVGLSRKVFSSKSGDIAGTVGAVREALGEDPFFAENGIPFDRCAQFALLAGSECLEHAGFDLSAESPYRCGVAIGTSLGGMLSGQTFHRQWLENGIDSADADLLVAYPLHTIVDIVAKRFGFRGVKTVISTACAASGNIVGYGCDMIRNGKHDVILAGGVDPLSSFSFAGFNALKALDPERCMPYSGSHGINLGEGGAFVLLEDYDHAVKRGATIYAEVLGYGLSADAYHPTAPDLGGGGASRAMQAAIRASGISVEDIDYVNGHGTGTHANDTAERLAFKAVFHDRVPEVALSSIKGAIGHCLGAAGGEECVASVMALNNGMVPPTVNFDPDFDPAPFDLVPNKAEKRDCRVILSNSFAFGGNNCCLSLGKPGFTGSAPEPVDDSVVITGMGCCGVGGVGIAQLWQTFENRTSCIGRVESAECRNHQAGVMPDVEWKKFIPSKFIRRIDEVTKLTMAAGKQALDHSKLRVTRESSNRIGVIYATGTGPLGTIVNIDKMIVEQGIASISLSDFPNSVINAAPGNFCIANMLKGPTSTLSNGVASFLLAFNYASELLHNDTADAIIVVSADECNEPLLIGNDKLDLLSRDDYRPLTPEADGMVLSPGAVAVVLEKESCARARGAKLLARVKGLGVSSDNGKLASVDPNGEALRVCVENAVREAGSPKIDLYLNTAMGVPACDEADANALQALTEAGVLRADTLCSTVSPLLGIASGTDAGYSLLAALHAFEKQEALGLPAGHPALRAGLEGRYARENRKADIHTACVSGMSLGGTFASLVLEQVND